MVASYGYDPLGRRVERVAGSTTTAWTYDGDDILRQTAGGATTTFVHGPGVDEPWATEVSGVLNGFYHVDALGSVLAASDSSGDVVATHRYDAYGNLQEDTPDLFAYTGREWDAPSELYYYRARYYDPKIGRFTSEDPVRWLGGVNFFAYSEDSPIDYVDPSGLESGSAFTQSYKAMGGRIVRPIDPVRDLRLRKPDFYQLSCQMGIGAFGLTMVPGTAAVPGVGGGTPSGCSCSATVNWLNTMSTPTSQQIMSFVTGPAGTVGAFYGAGGQVAILPDGSTATGWGGGLGFGATGTVGIDPLGPCDSGCAKRLRGALGAMSKK